MVKSTGWPLGINNVSADTALPEGSLRDAVNVDITKEGKVRSRPGETQVYSGTGCRSVFKHGDLVLFAEGTALKKLGADNVATTLVTGLSSSALVSYDVVNDEVYFSDGAILGIVDASGAYRAWGVPDPQGQPLVSAAASGTLDAGKYQVAITFENARGEESGATLATLVELTERGSIQLSSIPQNAAVAFVQVYITEPNDDVMRQAARVPIGVTSYNLTVAAYGKDLETQFMLRMPVGSIVRYGHGRMWVVNGKQVWYSEPLRFGLHKPAENFFSFAEDITVLEMTIDGVYVVADKTYFLGGADPAKAQQIVASPYKGTSGTGAKVSASIFDIEGVQGDIAYWYSEKGAMLGLPGGSVVPVMEDRVALPSFEIGSTTLKEKDGIRQMVTALYGPGDASEFGVSDAVVTEVIRNGITLN